MAIQTKVYLKQILTDFLFASNTEVLMDEPQNLPLYIHMYI